MDAHLIQKYLLGASARELVKFGGSSMPSSVTPHVQHSAAAGRDVR
jgi:hypothetical protein